LAEAVAGAERAFAPFSERRRADRSVWEASIAALRAQAAGWAAAAPAALAWLLDAPPDAATEGALQATVALALGAEPDVGSLDYHARNVVIQDGRLTLLDFAAVGADWPERRFVQYGTATGASRAGGGTFATVIEPASAQTYARLVAPQRGGGVDAVCRVVDAHDVVLLLTAAQHLRAVAAGAANPERAAAWCNVQERRARLAALLRRRVASDGPAEELRARVRRL
jgi:hypothetical protein